MKAYQIVILLIIIFMIAGYYTGNFLGNYNFYQCEKRANAYQENLEVNTLVEAGHTERLEIKNYSIYGMTCGAIAG